jgi:Zn-dependent protease
MGLIYVVSGILIFSGWVFSVCLHEFGHAIAAYHGGDTSVKHKGYLTLNPLKYADSTYSFLWPMVFLVIGGIGLPGGAVYIQEERLANRGWKSLVSAAGVMANALVALVLALPFQLGLVPEITPVAAFNASRFGLSFAISDQWLWYSLAFLVELQLSAVLLNLIPIPPLDGYGIIKPWLSPKWQYQCDRLSKYGFWMLMGLFWFVPPFTQAFWSIVRGFSQLLGVPALATLFGGMLFQHPLNRLMIFFCLLSACWLVKCSNSLQWYEQGNLWRVLQQRFWTFSLPVKSKSSQVPTAKMTAYMPQQSRKRGVWDDIRRAGLQRRLMILVQQQQDVANRLIALERVKKPGQTTEWYLEKVIYDLKRGR